MKKLVFLVVFIITVVSACNKDESWPEWIGIGTIQKEIPTADAFNIILDGGEILHPVRIIANNTYEDDDRVMVKYSIEEDNNDNTFEVKLFDLNKILTKDILQLTSGINDSIGNDPIYIEEDNIWITNHYLSFVFEYYGEFQTHYINLVKLYEDTHTEDGKLILEFRHNANGDFTSILRSGVISFDLDSLKEPGLDSVDFIVRIKKYGDNILEWEGSYTFESSLKSAGKSWPKNKRLKLSPITIK